MEMRRLLLKLAHRRNYSTICQFILVVYEACALTSLKNVMKHMELLKSISVRKILSIFCEQKFLRPNFGFLIVVPIRAYRRAQGRLNAPGA